MHREPEVLKAEAQVGECLDCRARVISKELAHDAVRFVSEFFHAAE